MPRISLDKIIEKSKSIYGENAFDYSKTICKDRNIFLICNRCKSEFWKPIHRHLGNQIRINGTRQGDCNKCSSENKTKIIITRNNFVEYANDYFKGKYTYDITTFKSTKSQMDIICPKHGIFKQTPYNHIFNRSGCPECAGNIKDNNERFIKKAVLVHGDEYDYSKVIINGSDHVIIIHKLCNRENRQRPAEHLMGKGCYQCHYNHANSTEQFKKDAIAIHGDIYEYDFVNYINNRMDVNITCKQHGLFSQRPNNHLSGAGCPTCGIISRNNLNRFTQEQFLEKCFEVHGDKYEYSKSIYINYTTPVEITCKHHGEFWQSPANHIWRGSNCPICAKSGFSIKAINWLNQISTIFNINIQHIANGGEYEVKYDNKKYKIDGVCHELQIAFEFDGDFWHGNPDIYPPNEINNVIGKTYGELYTKTLQKRKHLSELGWFVISVWEYDFDNNILLSKDQIEMIEIHKIFFLN